MNDIPHSLAALRMDVLAFKPPAEHRELEVLWGESQAALSGLKKRNVELFCQLQYITVHLYNITN